MTLGSQAQKSYPDWLGLVADRLILEGIAWDGEDPPLVKPVDGFSIWIGVENKDNWTGADQCVLIPASGIVGERRDGGALSALDTGTTNQKAITSLILGTEVRVWGAAPTTEISRGLSFRLAKLRRTWAILENVARVLHDSTAGFGRWVDLQAWQMETPIMRYGEEFTGIFAAPVPIYSYARTPLPVPLAPRFTGNPNVVDPGGVE